MAKRRPEPVSKAKVKSKAKPRPKPRGALVDPQFGRLTVDPHFEELLEGSAEWVGAKVRLSVKLDPDDPDPEPALETARALWKKMASWKKRIDAYAVRELLPLKNEAWLEPGERKVGRAAFLAAMKLRSISVRAGGSWEFWHDDGGLFAGHSIVVGGDLEDGPDDADIPG